MNDSINQSINQSSSIITRSFASAGILVSKEPTGIGHDSIKWPDGVTLVPWQSGRGIA